MSLLCKTSPSHPDTISSHPSCNFGSFLINIETNAPGSHGTFPNYGQKAESWGMPAVLGVITSRYMLMEEREVSHDMRIIYFILFVLCKKIFSA